MEQRGVEEGKWPQETTKRDYFAVTARTQQKTPFRLSHVSEDKVEMAR